MYSSNEIGRKDDPLTDYRSNKPTNLAKIIEHEPTAITRPKQSKDN